MSEKIIVPTLGESVTEATVAKWLKNKGDKVSSDEPLVELETDKVNVEVPSPTNGILDQISVNEGETVNVGALLGSISVSNVIKENIKDEKEYNPPIKDQKIEEKKSPEKKIKSIKNLKKIKDDDKPLILEKVEQKIFNEEPLILDNEHNDESINLPTKKHEIRISPSARKLVADKNIDIKKLQGSGKNGLVLK